MWAFKLECEGLNPELAENPVSGHSYSVLPSRGCLSCRTEQEIMRKNQPVSSRSAELPQPARLRIARTTALAQLQGRIDAGEVLLARYTDPDVDVVLLAKEKAAWQEINLVQLRQMFTTDEYLKEYERQSIYHPPSNFRMFAVAGPSRPQLPPPPPAPGPSQQSLVHQAVDCLRSIGNQVVHIEEELPKIESPRSLPQSIYIENMHNSAIQQGTYGSNQSLSVGQQHLDDVTGFVQQLRQYLDLLPLDADAKQDVSAQIFSVEGQLKSPRPSGLVVKESIRVVGLSLETIKENVIAAGLLQRVATLLSSLTS